MLFIYAYRERHKKITCIVFLILSLRLYASMKKSLSFDRGYGKMSFVESTAEKNFEVIKIATTLGSRQLFLTKEEVSKVEENW